MREIVLDTETTGIYPLKGDRIVEIGCVELENHLPTGREFHKYLNPERDMPEEAFKVHGLSEEFLSDKPLFMEVVGEFIEFIGDAKLVIHNAPFDMGFINAEMSRIKMPSLPMTRAVDTLVMARTRFPGAPASLDALCRRFGVDNSARTDHGALLDSKILAEVYLHLIGGRQPDLGLAHAGGNSRGGSTRSVTRDRTARPPRSFPLTEAELEAHAKFIATLKNPLWNS